ncbi:NAD-dependent epimerase/dehydratase family protein [Candidatus Pelagibacter bacterium]|nr:NAD-dependent epimerase/dehydratase family protein [Candidatus Pelagibacter bacterium]
MKKVLITGGTGFLGSHLIRNLYKEYKVTSISRKKILKQKLITKVKYLFFDISKYNLVKKNLEKKKFDFIINCCGNINHNNKIETYDAHLKVVKNLIKIFKNKKIKKFIQIGSCLEYGSLKSPQKENERCVPNSNYGNAKYLAAKAIKKNFPKNYLILRPYQIFGPSQKLDRLIPMTIHSCLNNKSFFCTSGSQERDFLYIDDFVKLIKTILKKNSQINNNIFNVGSGKPYKVKFIIKKIKTKIKKGKPQFGKIKMRKDEIMKLYPSIKKIKNQLKWFPKTNIDKALSKTIQYYKKLHLY